MGSKAIKVDEQVKGQLDQLRGKGETYSEVIAGLLSARLKVLEFISILEGQLKFHEWQKQKLDAILAQQGGDHGPGH